MKTLAIMAAALVMAGCASENSNTFFANTTAFGLKVGQSPTGTPEAVIGQASANVAILPNTTIEGEILSSRSEEGAEGQDSWRMSEDGRSVFSCAGSSSLFGRDGNDVGIDSIFSSGTAASIAAMHSRCARGGQLRQ
jgi:hypothetical protein